mgnify:CR=1 FL=1
MTSIHARAVAVALHALVFSACGGTEVDCRRESDAATERAEAGQKERQDRLAQTIGRGLANLAWAALLGELSDEPSAPTGGEGAEAGAGIEGSAATQRRVQLVGSAQGFLSAGVLTGIRVRAKVEGRAEPVPLYACWVGSDDKPYDVDTATLPETITDNARLVESRTEFSGGQTPGGELIVELYLP